jgi:sugar lactone lactonase YvrE
MQQVATGYGLIEGPVWAPARGLYFSDVINGGVFLLDRAAGSHRRSRSGAALAAWRCTTRTGWW